MLTLTCYISLHYFVDVLSFVRSFVLRFSSFFVLFFFLLFFFFLAFQIPDFVSVLVVFSFQHHNGIILRRHTYSNTFCCCYSFHIRFVFFGVYCAFMYSVYKMYYGPRALFWRSQAFVILPNRCILAYKTHTHSYRHSIERKSKIINFNLLIY